MKRTIDEKLITDIVNRLKELSGNREPKIAIILGSGLSGLVNMMKNTTVIPYSALKNMPESKVKGHLSQFVVGELHGKTIIAMQGRFHAYDGFTAKEVALPIYIFKKLGAETVIITNAAGGINKKYDAGDIMLIKSHINFTGMNPLVDGAVIDYGKQFIDLNNVYDRDYIGMMKRIAKEEHIDIKVGTYAQYLGPSYETQAEVEMLRKMGADTVAMSTALEVIAAGQCQLKVLGISCVANKAISYRQKKELTHEEVLESSKKAVKKLEILLPLFIKEL